VRRYQAGFWQDCTDFRIKFALYNLLVSEYNTAIHGSCVWLEDGETCDTNRIFYQYAQHDDAPGPLARLLCLCQELLTPA
jgi:hypothetical protein